MTTPTDARGTLLYDLDKVLLAHQHDPERCGLEAVRSLRAAGMTWQDLFCPVMAAEPCFRETSDLAEARAIRAATELRGAHRTLFLATPAQLAMMAVVLCRPDWTNGEMDRVGTLLLQLDYQVIEEMLRPRFAISIAEEL